MVVQDVIAILILLFLTTSHLQSAPFIIYFIFFLKAIVLVALLFIVAKYLLPYILDRIAGSGELLLLFTVSWCFVVATGIYLFGFSFEIGAIAAGLALGNSLYRTEIGSRIRPLRDFFLVLFFVLLGSKLTLPGITHALIPGFILSAFVLIIDPIILYILFRAHRYAAQQLSYRPHRASQRIWFHSFYRGRARPCCRTSVGDFHDCRAHYHCVIALDYPQRTLYKLLRPLPTFWGRCNPATRRTIPTYDIWVIGYHRIGWKIARRSRKRLVICRRRF